MFKVRRSPKIKHNKSRVYKKPDMKEVGKMLKRVRRINEQLDEVKPLYHELDEITAALMQVRHKLSGEASLSKYGVAIIDNFAEKNTVFRTVGIRRYEIRWAK